MSPPPPSPSIPAAAADQCDGLDGRQELLVAQTILSCVDGRQLGAFHSFLISPSPSFHSKWNPLSFFSPVVFRPGFYLLTPPPSKKSCKQIQEMIVFSTNHDAS